MSDGNYSETTSADGAIWAAEYTPITKFEYSIEDGNIYIGRYKGNNRGIWVAPSYENVIDSREVAGMVGKQHKNLLRGIAGYIKVMEESDGLKIEPVDFFILSAYQDGKGETRPCYCSIRPGFEE